MSERIKCPSCGAGLILLDLARGSAATCPRCLAEISTISTSVPGREADTIQTERPERRDEPLSGQQRGRYGPPDVDVRRDTKRTGCLVIGLAVIGGLGLGLGLGWMGLEFQFFAANGYYYYSPLLFLVVSVLFLAGISTLIVFVRSGGNPGASGFRRVAVGTLALAGAIILVILAVGVFFFVVSAAVYFGR
jgi:hypothetical protein